jgi:hypothetical protein
MFAFTKLKIMLLAVFALAPQMAGTFDSHDGTYDEQTGFAFDKQRFIESRNRSIVGPLSKGSDKVSGMIAGGENKNIGAVIRRKEISEGDMVRFTMEETVKGTPTWGDNPTQRGDFLLYKNQEARINLIKSPAIPIQGEMNQQRVAHSINDLPGSVRRAIIDYMSEEMEFEFLTSLLWGASKALLAGTSDGGLAVSLGVGSGVGAGTPLWCKNFYCIDQGFPAYVQSTWNSTVNGYINAISAAADAITTVKIKHIRNRLDKILFQPVVVDGKKYKAVCLCDPDIWYKIDHLLATARTSARERGKDNPIFHLHETLEYLDILFVNVPNLEKFRPAYNASTSIPDIGPGLTLDPRSYTTSSSVGLTIFLGAGAVLEGYNGKVELSRATAAHGAHEGLEVAARTKLGYIRGEWYSKDGRAVAADNTYNNSSLVACWYETGTGDLT